MITNTKIIWKELIKITCKCVENNRFFIINQIKKASSVLDLFWFKALMRKRRRLKEYEETLAYMRVSPSPLAPPPPPALLSKR